MCKYNRQTSDFYNQIKIFMEADIINYWWHGRAGINSFVSEYETRVVAAGGALQAGDATLLNSFVNAMITNGTWTGYEFYPFMGGFNGSLQKLNPINPSFLTLTNN